MLLNMLHSTFKYNHRLRGTLFKAVYPVLAVEDKGIQYNAQRYIKSAQCRRHCLCFRRSANAPCCLEAVSLSIMSLPRSRRAGAMIEIECASTSLTQPARFALGRELGTA